MLTITGWRSEGTGFTACFYRYDLVVKMKKYCVVTTDSRVWRHQYPNLVKGAQVERAN